MANPNFSDLPTFEPSAQDFCIARMASWLRKLRRCENGQATTEYIMLLALAVAFFLIIVRTLKPAFAKLFSRLNTQMGGALFNSGSLHRFPFH